MTCDCDREQDVLDALAAGRWPDRCDEELRRHVSGCAICRDLADVAPVLMDEQEVARRSARVPSAGVVWWRAQLRAREDAARTAGRPVAFVQGVAASVAVWLVLSLFRTIPSESVAQWRTWATALVPDVPFAMSEVSRATAILPLVVFVIVGAWLLLAPIVSYLAVADE
jgi:hypothetical protein